ncbi:MAG: hypothetical protein LAN64_16900 [Acidobacteriia bacterium]|nr:hypothetical protein [Terriglobia bacterium]
MNYNQPLPPAKPSLPSMGMDKPCEHPRVRIVAREEDSEFVECLECGDIFESSEFKDMAIEERSTGTDA